MAASDRFEIVAIDVATHWMRTRMPFRFGIAVMEALPHMIVRMRVRTGVAESVGFAAEGLLPKWFEKDPESSAEEDLRRMWHAVRSAGLAATEHSSATGAFEWWLDLYRHQEHTLGGTGYPPLLWNFGVSVIERALIDALCRGWDTTFAQALAADRFRLRPDALHAGLSDAAVRRVVGAEALPSLHLRHTVGMSDPLTPEDVASPIGDGLPECLADDIRVYGLTHFKIKVANHFDQDRDRLETVFRTIESAGVGSYAFTLDGNEQFHSMAEFRDYWEHLTSDEVLRSRMGSLLFVEQPVARAAALGEESGRDLLRWGERPPMIIDESDGDIAALPAALESGYAGTSHKNCKGVFKGVVNRILVEQRRIDDSDRTYVMSGEDLVNIGPVALLQDLASMAALGIGHVERNGHHYFRGLSMFPPEIEDAVLRDHAPLYRRHPRGFVELYATDGRLDLASVNRMPFGSGIVPDALEYVPIAQWEAPPAP